MDKLLETHNLPKLKQEESENVNKQITPNEIEAALRKLLKTKALDLIASQLNFIKYSDKIFDKIHLYFSNYFKKFKRREDSQTHLM